ncbi:ATP-binding protein [Bacillus massilinigeriensis]|uniref:ATP-binding protein n=1 Tax=Bacillus mediterraneensis TaxID=1805474 RepID=UPI0008F83A54|nr:ATP-binding protein [Bacillus mediterraneensis]
MNPYEKDTLLSYEEVKTTKFFLWIFYFLLYFYDTFHYFLVPYYSKMEYGLPRDGIGIYYHVFLTALLPVATFLFIKNKVYIIKYLYIFAFILIDAVNIMMIYYGTDKQFTAWHIEEAFFILFCPIFLNKKYYWVVSVGLIAKYIFTGLILDSTAVALPLFLILFLSFISWVFLSRSISYMNTLITVNENMRRQEKLAVIGGMATAIAHEIKNPLSTLKGFTQLQKEQEKDSDSFYSIMLKEIDRINAILNDLLFLGKPSHLQKTETSMENILKYVISAMKFQTGGKAIDFTLDIPSDMPKINCDENQMKQVFINLIKNSIEAIPVKGSISVSAALYGKKMKITIQDSGDGIPKDELSRLFDPFFTTKEDGTGLGLIVTKKIIEEHQGEICFESEEGRGTTAVITLNVRE